MAKAGAIPSRICSEPRRSEEAQVEPALPRRSKGEAGEPKP